MCLQSSLIEDVRFAVAENANSGTGVARGNVTPCSQDAKSQRAVASAAANSRDELNTSTSSSTSRNSGDVTAKSPGNHSLLCDRNNSRLNEHCNRKHKLEICPLPHINSFELQTIKPIKTSQKQTYRNAPVSG